MADWTSVSKLSVVLETGEQQCETEADAKGRIGVVISIQPTDDNGNPIEVDATTLNDKTSLIDYVDESEIPLRNASITQDWSYEKASSPEVKKGRTPQLRFEVYHSKDPVHAKAIGVLVTTAKGPSYYSSLNGTYHSSVRIRPVTS
ncbi:hypothetical protein ACTWP5_26415 [Streptomyces sp. 4N509B]|uniref:hypothetical protein n=1 Tax=Streptomyces sp. 4N509B TaxID=3457413 RepID=UPI003FD09756